MKQKRQSRTDSDIVRAAKAFLKEAHPTTVRGVAYYLLGIGVIKSMTRRWMNRVSDHLTRSREAGVIPWEWLDDYTRKPERVSVWSDLSDYFDTVRVAYRKDLWLSQPHDVELWSEKRTVRVYLKPVLDEFAVRVRYMSGAGSATVLHDVAVERSGAHARPLRIIYVGDWDPTGTWLSDDDIPGRLEKYGGDLATISRVALVQSDLARLTVNPISPKPKDTRSKAFIAKYGTACYELDAMDPRDLRRKVRAAIRRQIVARDAWARAEAAEKRERETLASLPLINQEDT